MGHRHDLYLMLHLPPHVARVAERLLGLPDARLRGGSKPMAAQRLHITLVPLGGYLQGIAPDALRLATAAGALVRQAPFRVTFDTLQALGWMGEAGTAELVGRGPGLLPLLRLRRQLTDTLHQVGWSEPLRQRFRPHVTLDYHHEPFAAYRIEPLTWTVTEFLLIDSHYGKGRHEVLARWPLQNPQAALFD